jgi:hypothetical protein
MKGSRHGGRRAALPPGSTAASRLPAPLTGHRLAVRQGARTREAPSTGRVEPKRSGQSPTPRPLRPEHSPLCGRDVCRGKRMQPPFEPRDPGQAGWGMQSGQRARRAASASVGGTPRRTIPEQIPPRVPRDTVNLGQFRAISDQFRSEVRRRHVWVMLTISTS